MISYKIELILTLIFFTSCFGMDKTHPSLFSSEKLEDLKNMRDYEVLNCENIVTSAGFDANNGLYNYSLTMQFNDSEILEKYLKNNIDSIPDKDIKTIVQFYNAIKAKEIDIKYIPQTPKQFCEELDVKVRNQDVYNHLGKESKKVNPETFCDELDIPKTPEEFCKIILIDMELFETIVNEELRLNEFDISKTPEDFCKSGIIDMELFETIVYEELQLNANTVKAESSFVEHEYSKNPKDFCWSIAHNVSLYESIINDELKTNEEFDKALTPEEFCSRGEKDKNLYKSLIPDQIIEAEFKIASKKFCEDLSALKSPWEFCDANVVVKTNSVVVKTNSEFRLSGLYGFTIAMTEKRNCAINIKKNGYYSDDPYTNFVQSYTFYCRLESNRGKMWKNLEDLSKNQIMYYEYHEEMFDKMDKTLLSMCPILIKENGYFDDDPYFNIVKSYTYYRNYKYRTFGLLHVTSIHYINHFTPKNTNELIGKRWDNIKDLSEIQGQYYNFHKRAFDKLDKKLPSMCPSALKKKGYFSDNPFANFVKSYTYYLKLQKISTKDYTNSIIIEGLSEKRWNNIFDLTDVQKEYYYFFYSKFHIMNDKLPSMCSSAIKKNEYFSDNPFSNFVKSYIYHHTSSNAAYKHTQLEKLSEKRWSDEKQLSDIQMAYYNYHKLEFDKLDNKMPSMCSSAIKKNEYFSDNPFANFVKSYTYYHNISCWAYDQPGQKWNNEDNLSNIQMAYYNHHKLAFDTLDKNICTISIKKNQYYSDKPFSNFVKSFTFYKYSKILQENMAAEKQKCDETHINHAVNPYGCQHLYQIIAKKDTKTTNIEILAGDIWKKIDELSDFQKKYYIYQKNIFESQNEILDEQYSVKNFCKDHTISQPSDSIS